MSEPFLSHRAMDAIVNGRPIEPIGVLYGETADSRLTIGMHPYFWEHVQHALGWSRCSCSRCQELYECFTKALDDL
jgi:hypothetical protein